MTQEVKKSPRGTKAAIAKAMGVHQSHVTHMVAAGMPAGSVAEALEWRARRKGMRSVAPEVRADPSEIAAIEPVDPGKALGMLAELEAQITNARRMAATAQRRAQSEIETGDLEAAKKAQEVYASCCRNLLLIENTLRQRRVDAGQLVPMEAAVERFAKRIAVFLAALDAEEAEFSISANPDNPGRAAKAYRAMRERIRKKAATV